MFSFKLNRLCTALLLLSCLGVQVISAGPVVSPIQSYKKLERRDGDRREYASMTLQNKLQTLLVHDETAKRAAIVLTYRDGQYNDHGIPGLHHWAEHACFTGSGLWQWAAQNGGKCSATTMHQSTVYDFAVPDKAFESAVIKMRDMFLDPQSKIYVAASQVPIIQHEYEERMCLRGPLLHEIGKEVLLPDIPAHLNSCGNEVTLTSLHAKQALKELLGRYTPDHMQLVIVSSRSLNNMRDIVADAFSILRASSPVCRQGSVLPKLIEDRSARRRYRLGQSVKAKSFEKEPAMKMTFLIPDAFQSLVTLFLVFICCYSV